MNNKLSLLCSIFFLLIGCQQKIAKDDYFPLHKGLTWHYQVTKSLTDQKTVFFDYHVENTGKINNDEHYPNDDIYVRHTSDGTDYFFIQDDVASYRVAKRTIVEQTPRFDETLRQIIPSAQAMEVDSSWTNNTKAYLIYTVPPHIMRKDIGSNLSMLFQVVAKDETVTVPAGTFKHCIKIVGTAEFSFFADAVQGYKTVPVTQTEWYAPGVGLVKLERDEELNQSLFKGGKLSYELLEFSAG